MLLLSISCVCSEILCFLLIQAICKTVREIAKPIIAEQIPKFKIDSVDFEALTLGSLPPTFQGTDVIQLFRFNIRGILCETFMKYSIES